jgi:3-oxoacyl-[acyl-carrier-protein] synthase II
LLSDMDMIVAAGGGERDLAVDTAILAGVPKADNPPVFVNERLMNDLRPTLFLAQLSNLLAGNISIVHGVIGSSRTFMGEDSAGVDAVRIAMSRIGAGQSKIALVGGAYNSERWDIVQHLIMGGVLRQGEPSGVWERAANGGGTELGTIGAFLVLEESEHARARGAKGWAKISAVQSDRTRRKPGEVGATLTRMWDKIAPATDGTAVISGATGIEPATGEERDFLGRRGLPVRGTNTYLGQALEPQFPINIALAAAALDHGTLFPPCDRSGFEQPMAGPLSRVVVTSVGLWRGEALALVEAVR